MFSKKKFDLIISIGNPIRGWTGQHNSSKKESADNRSKKHPETSPVCFTLYSISTFFFNYENILQYFFNEK